MTSSAARMKAKKTRHMSGDCSSWSQETLSTTATGLVGLCGMMATSSARYLQWERGARCGARCVWEGGGDVQRQAPAAACVAPRCP
eukprot:152984-Chlamydomonas_euryale.AAC.1